MDQMTLAVVLTAAGATASAALVTGLIAMLKQTVIGPWIKADNEPTLAFILSAVLVAVAVLSVGVFTPASLFAGFLAWFGVAQVAMGVHDTIKAQTSKSPKAPAAPETE
jgi:hypothetical protein